MSGKRFACKTGLVTIGIAALVISLIVGCTPGNGTPTPTLPVATATEETHIGGTLRFGRSADSPTLDPPYATNEESIKVINVIYDRLLQFDPETFEVEPGLAEIWNISADELTWTFYLRENVKFHDGTDVNAEAIKFNFDRMLNKEHPGYFGKSSFGKFLFGAIEETRVVDEYTVQIVLSRKYAPLQYALPVFAGSIASPAAVQKYGEDFAQHPVGSGPFKLVSWTLDEEIVLEANEDYWGGRPAIDRIVFVVIPDNQERLAALEQGDLDMMDGLEPADISAVMADESLVLYKKPGMSVGYMGLNTQMEPFSNPQVRQAVNFALNKQRIIHEVFNDAALESIGPLPPGSWGYDVSLRQYDYDPAKAETLLAEAGYPDGFETTLFISPVSRPYNPNPVGLAEAVQRDLAEVGIEVEIKIFDVRAEYSAAIDADEPPMFLLGWSGGPPDPYFYLNPLLSTPMIAANLNDANYSNPQVDELLTEAAETMDRSARRQLYVEAQRIIIDDAPWAFMNHMMYMVVTSSRVQGFKLHATSLLKLGGVYLTE